MPLRATAVQRPRNIFPWESLSLGRTERNLTECAGRIQRADELDHVVCRQKSFSTQVFVHWRIVVMNPLNSAAIRLVWNSLLEMV